MMSLPKKHIAFSITIILLLISVLVFIIHKSPISRENKLFAGVRERKADTKFTKRSMLVNDKLVLLKDNSVNFNKCKMVFRGFKDKKIHLDLYILELDPESAYTHYISKKNDTKGFRLGDMDFELISAKQNVLKLRIKDTN